jgi:hypothetical protein
VVVQAAMSIPVTELVVGDVYQCNIYRFLGPTRPLTEIRDHDDIWMYHIQSVPGVEERRAERKSKVVDTGLYRRPDEASEIVADVVVCITRKEVRLCDACQRDTRPRVTCRTLPRSVRAPSLRLRACCEQYIVDYGATYGRPSAKQSRFAGAADPHLINIPFTAGGYDRAPTGKQVRVCRVCVRASVVCVCACLSCACVRAIAQMVPVCARCAAACHCVVAREALREHGVRHGVLRGAPAIRAEPHAQGWVCRCDGVCVLGAASW